MIYVDASPFLGQVIGEEENHEQFLVADFSRSIPLTNRASLSLSLSLFFVIQIATLICQTYPV
ncbi:hypothetical protein Bca4012_056498 [Brassica carinata]